MEARSKTAKVICAEVSLPKGSSAKEELARIAGENPGVAVQMVRLERRPNVKAVELIGAQTLRAKRTGAMVADRPEVDLLLRLAGTTQISQAIATSGYEARGRLLLVAAGPDKKVERLVTGLGERGKRRWYRMLPSGTLDPDGRTMVEKAALLGTRD